jgi:hypothetical protein
MNKRGLIPEFEEDDDEEEIYDGLTNAERLRRGLPLAKPVKRDANVAAWHRPSCTPHHVTSTIISYSGTTTVTPTDLTTVKKCAFTETLDYIGEYSQLRLKLIRAVHATTTETDTKTKKATIVCIALTSD